jgi:bifunctional UDP-N-acetylglucosamine pyrophosphorylase/glucosamine-1-phosphate N-acetyltransferase
MTDTAVAALILAAGRGTRMKSALPKVMHRLAHRPMVEHVLQAVGPLQPQRTLVVIGAEMDSVAEAVRPAEIVVQTVARGTGDAVAVARGALHGFGGDVLVLCGDAPLITAATLGRLLAERRRAPEAAIVVLGMRPADPGAYGRLIVGADGTLDAIVEAADCTPEQRAVTLCNSAIMAIDGRRLFSLLDEVGTDNAQGERYLTDIVAVARRHGFLCRAIEAPAEELMGVNSRADLAAAEAAMQDRLRRAAMEGGVTLMAPETVFFSADTRLGRDCVVGPFVVFGPGVTIGDGVEIPAFCHLAGATVGDRAIIGPFARLRPGAELAADVHIGNFVEVKNSRLATGVKANHLAYLGDSDVGAGTNVGAGVITCNYDGFEKFRTHIGAGVFVGTNASLVAPVTLGDGAFVAAGSVITQDVPADAMAIARGSQVTKRDFARKWRDHRRAEKAARAAGIAARQAGAEKDKP